MRTNQTKAQLRVLLKNIDTGKNSIIKMTIPILLNI